MRNCLSAAARRQYAARIAPKADGSVTVLQENMFPRMGARRLVNGEAVCGSTPLTEVDLPESLCLVATPTDSLYVFLPPAPQEEIEAEAPAAPLLAGEAEIPDAAEAVMRFCPGSRIRCLTLHLFLCKLRGMKKVLCVLSLPLLLLTACQTAEQNQRSAKEEEARKQLMAPPLHLGAVYQVYPENHFAMIRLIGPRPAEGATLITHPADGSTDRVGNLCVASGQHSREGLIAADIRSGTVIKGDRVFLYQRIAAPDSREQDTETQPTAGNETEPAAIPAPRTESPETVADDTVTEGQPAIPAPAVDTTVLPEDETGTPTPETPSPKLDGIPDTFDGWDN